ncbi:MAG: lysylphosphatidylglycerol synthase domain-containing protein [Desulfobacula sp.]
MMGFKKWRSLASKLVLTCVLVAMVYWSWENWATIRNVFVDLSAVTLIELSILMTFGIVCQTLSFTLLIRGMGYPFSYIDSYHSLNLSQVAAMVPGKIWGFAGLVGLLCARGVSKSDSLLIIALQTLLMLSAAVCVGASGLIPIIGWKYTILSLLPVLLVLFGHPWLQRFRLKYFSSSSSLPMPLVMVLTLLIGIISWIAISVGFLIMISTALGDWPPNPLIVVGSFPAGYVAGFISMIAPSGLGIREGVITLILAPLVGHEKGMAMAVVFRVIHMAILWINILVTLAMLSFRKGDSPIGYNGL